MMNVSNNRGPGASQETSFGGKTALENVGQKKEGRAQGSRPGVWLICPLGIAECAEKCAQVRTEVCTSAHRLMIALLGVVLGVLKKPFLY